MNRGSQLISLALAFALFGCGGDDVQPGTDAGPTDPGPDADPALPTPVCTTDAPQLPPLVEKRSVYDQDELDVLVLELQVNDLQMLQNIEDNVDGAETAVTFVERGVYGESAVAPNATLKLRGRSTRFALQKSYKIKLDSQTDLWRGQRELNLNKHPYDLTRVRNKLSFDLMRGVPNFSSLRTQFVHLFINGVDKGMFTHIEEADKRFLYSHGLDPSGALYKVARYNFREIDPEVAADPVAFESVVESKAIPNREKFLRMAEAVVDPAQDINTTIETYFNRDNYMTWLAVNMLLGNFDTGSSNYYLYSPSTCEGWYFLPWDYDGALSFYEQPGNPPRPRWRAGVANWWLPTLHRRFFQDPKNLSDLMELVASLRASVITDAAIADRLDAYFPVITPFVQSAPDVWNLPVFNEPTQDGLIARWGEEYERAYGVVAGLVAELAEVAERPMPMRLHGVDIVSPTELRFTWDDSYDLQGDSLTYDFALSTTPDFIGADVIAEQIGSAETRIVVPTPPPGIYYWRVQIFDEHGNWQVPFHDFEVLDVP